MLLVNSDQDELEFFELDDTATFPNGRGIGEFAQINAAQTVSPWPRAAGITPHATSMEVVYRQKARECAARARSAQRNSDIKAEWEALTIGWHELAQIFIVQTGPQSNS